MSDDDLSAEEEFAVLINKVMAKGIQDGADPDQMAKICRYAVDWCDLSAAEWADMTGRDSSTVARNVRRARD
jgi:hypothetical protein